jgi:hypothetical protein
MKTLQKIITNGDIESLKLTACEILKQIGRNNVDIDYSLTKFINYNKNKDLDDDTILKFLLKWLNNEKKELLQNNSPENINHMEAMSVVERFIREHPDNQYKYNNIIFVYENGISKKERQS